MNIIKKMILYIRDIFNKQEEVKKLKAPKDVLNKEKKDNFIATLKTTKKDKVETLICVGDGLGIRKQMRY